MATSQPSSIPPAVPLRVFDKILNDLTVHEKSYQAEKTIKGIISLHNHIVEIAKIEDTKERYKKISDLTGLTAYGDFCDSKDFQNRIINLNEKVNLLKVSYLKSAQENYLDDFFTNAFRGDPCFNARIANLENYHARKSGFSPESLDDPVFSNVRISLNAAQLTELLDHLYDYQDICDERDEKISEIGFQNYLKEKDFDSPDVEEAIFSKQFSEIYKQLIASM